MVVLPGKKTTGRNNVVVVQYKTHSDLPYFLDLAPTPFKRRIDKAHEFAINAVVVNSGLGVCSPGPDVYSKLY